MISGVDIPVKGTCVTRNGETEVGRMTCSLKGEQVDIRFVSAKLHRLLHAGAVIRVVDADAFCTAWLAMRGLPLNGRSEALARAKNHLALAALDLSAVE